MEREGKILGSGKKKIWTRALKFLFRKQLAAAVNRRKAGNGGESERS